ncbi:hypothetical protein DFS34DRAFT_159519 [Phlyctochytrium arcticum]|nr:hypothetical protein DFS34DRAFT_159519 [Phlyctochytrium arcticum]
MEVKKAFHGPRSARFQILPPVTGPIGPGGYDVDEATRLATVALQKPISNKGLLVRTSERFPRIPESSTFGLYTASSFLDVLKQRPTSLREPLSSLSPKSELGKQMDRPSRNIPGPGTYDINYANGRHVSNDDRFSIYKSDRIRERDAQNRDQLLELRKLLGANDLFTDKRACRRMAHLALYY